VRADPRDARHAQVAFDRRDRVQRGVDPQSGKSSLPAPVAAVGLGRFMHNHQAVSEGTALATCVRKARRSGIEIADSSVRAADVRLTGMSLEDNKSRFALFGVSGQIRGGVMRIAGQHRDQRRRSVAAAFGQFTLPLNMKNACCRDKLEVPLLDARLTVSDFSAGPAATDALEFWRRLTPVSLERFTQSLGCRHARFAVRVIPG